MSRVLGDDNYKRYARVAVGVARLKNKQTNINPDSLVSNENVRIYVTSGLLKCTFDIHGNNSWFKKKMIVRFQILQLRTLVQNNIE